MSYTKTTWRNNQAPAINADNLNHMEQGIESAHNQIDVNTSNIESLTTQVQNNATNIASEISARQTTDSSLQSQIDQLVAPTGEAPNPAEIENARIGDDGVTYDTLGNAIRTQFSNVKSEITQEKNALDLFEDVCRNVFTGNYFLGYAVLTNGVFSAASNCVTAVIPCEGGETYFIKVGTPHNRFTIAWSANPFPLGETVNVITPEYPESVSENYKVTVPSTAKSLLIYVSNQNETPSLYVGESELYEPISYASPIKASFKDDFVEDKVFQFQEAQKREKLYNIFDGNYIKNVALHNIGSAENLLYSNATSFRTLIVPINPNTTYYIDVFGDHDRFRLGTSDSYPILGTKVDFIVNDPALSDWNFTSNENAHWLILTVSSTLQEPSINVMEGFRALSFIGYSNATESSPEDFITTNKARQLSNNLSSKYYVNLFDGNYIPYQGLVVDNEVLTYLPYWDNQQTAIVPVKPNTTYHIRTFDPHNRFRIGTSSNVPKFGDSLTYIISQSVENTPLHWSFTTNWDARWMAITVTNQGETPRMQVIEGEDLVTFIGYDNIKSRGGEGIVDVKYHFLDDIEGIFDAETVPSAIDASTTRISDVYSIYDSLVSAHSNYVSKTVLGTVSTENLEMRKYVFNSIQIQNNSSYLMKKPKLILLAGIHGYEQGSAYCLARVMKQITEGTDSISKFIRNNVEIIVVPIGNPYGYNHNERKNQNGVDLNRNFAAGWVASGSPSDEYYGGASPNSEEETQILTSLLDDNSDAYYAVDFHNIANGYPLMYLYNNEQAQFCNSLFVTLTNKWLSEYIGFPTSRLLGYCNTGVNACFAKQAIVNGINSFVAEAPWVMPVIGSEQYDVPTLTVGCDVFGNVLAMIAKSMI